MKNTNFSTLHNFLLVFDMDTDNRSWIASTDILNLCYWLANMVLTTDYTNISLSFILAYSNETIINLQVLLALYIITIHEFNWNHQMKVKYIVLCFKLNVS